MYAIRSYYAIPNESRALFYDLSPFLSGKTFDEMDYWSNALQGCQVGEVQRGVPMQVLPRLIYYNQNLLDSVGLSLPQAGWTWQDFRTLVETAANPDGDSPLYGYLDTSTYSLLNPLIDQVLSGSDDPP